LDDPVGKPIEVFRKTRDIIEEKVKELMEKIKNNELKLQVTGLRQAS
jgi:arsenate reductase